MRRVNPQWVFLIILALWIPVLCFADETEATTLAEETVIQEKIENLRRLQTTVAQVREERAIADAAKEEAERLAAEAEDEPWLITKIWVIGVVILGAPALVFCAAMTLSSMWQSMRLNYHMYVQYGEFVFVKADTTEREDARAEVAKTIKNFDTKNVDEYAWFYVIGMSLVATLIIVAGVFLWPITSVMFGPQLITSAIAWRKRKKVVFEKKLKGVKTDVPV